MTAQQPMRAVVWQVGDDPRFGTPVTIHAYRTFDGPMNYSVERGIRTLDEDGCWGRNAHLFPTWEDAAYAADEAVRDLVSRYDAAGVPVSGRGKETR